MQYEARLRLSKSDCLIERVQCQLGVDRSAGGPADDASREEVLYGAEVNEAFLCVDVSEIGEPDFVWLLSFKSLV